MRKKKKKKGLKKVEFFVWLGGPGLAQNPAGLVGWTGFGLERVGLRRLTGLRRGVQPESGQRRASSWPNAQTGQAGQARANSRYRSSSTGPAQFATLVTTVKISKIVK